MRRRRFEIDAPARRPDAARRPRPRRDAVRGARERSRHPSQTQAARAAAAAPGPARTCETAKQHRSLIDGVEGGPSKPCEAPVSATLVLKDGQRLEGTSFGAKVNRPGEVVFNTGMVF